MLTIDPASLGALGALAVQLAKVDAAQLAVSDAIDTLEAAANAATANPDKEPARLACVQALRAASGEYNDELIDLAEDVRVALYGEAEDGDEE